MLVTCGDALCSDPAAIGASLSSTVPQSPVVASTSSTVAQRPAVAVAQPRQGCTDVAHRTDCGHPGISQQTCEGKQCCWNVTQPVPGAHDAVCFFPTGAPPRPSPPHPSPPPQPPGPPPPLPPPLPPGVLWASTSLAAENSTLWWPSPLVARAYSIADRPRFVVPEWGATPIPPDKLVSGARRGHLDRLIGSAQHNLIDPSRATNRSEACFAVCAPFVVTWLETPAMAIFAAHVW